jgi:hypothetical protein
MIKDKHSFIDFQQDKNILERKLHMVGVNLFAQHYPRGVS